MIHQLYFLTDGHWRGEDAVAGFAEGFHQRTVFKFRNQGRRDALLVEPLLQRAADGVVHGRQQNRGFIQRMGKILFILSRRTLLAKQGQFAGPEGMAERLD